jgi:hypothetical protein
LFPKISCTFIVVLADLLQFEDVSSVWSDPMPDQALLITLGG